MAAATWRRRAPRSSSSPVRPRLQSERADIRKRGPEIRRFRVATRKQRVLPDLPTALRSHPVAADGPCHDGARAKARVHDNRVRQLFGRLRNGRSQLFERQSLLGTGRKLPREFVVNEGGICPSTNESSQRTASRRCLRFGRSLSMSSRSPRSQHRSEQTPWSGIVGSPSANEAVGRVREYRSLEREISISREW